jgi:hypothetical protein
MNMETKALRTGWWIASLALAVLLFSGGAAQAAEVWWWVADNHTGTSPGPYTSLWTDNSHQFVNVTFSGGWDIWWENKNGAATPGWATVDGPGTATGRYLTKTDFAGSSNDPAGPGYWNIYNGLTVAWKANIPAVDGASGNGNIRISVQNPSATGFTGQTSSGFDGYIGWDENGNGLQGVGISFWTPAGGQMANWIDPTVPIIGVDTVWLLILTRYDDNTNNVHELYWDLCIEGQWQGKTAPETRGTQTWGGKLGADGQYHACVGAKWENGGTDIYFGQRRSQASNTRYALDFIAVTNEAKDCSWIPVPPSCGSTVTPLIPQSVWAPRGSAAIPSVIQYTLGNSGTTGGLTYTVAETDVTGNTPVDYAWLDLGGKTGGGPLDPMATDTVTATVTDTSMAPGLYTAYVTFVDNCTPPNKHIRQIDLTIVGCRMQVDTDYDIYRAVATSTEQPEPVIYTVTNTGAGSFSYTVTKEPNDVSTAWLTLNSGLGGALGGSGAESIGPLSYLQADQVTATINPTGLSEGTHSCQLKFTPTCDTEPNAGVQYRTIHLSVRDASSTTQWFNAEFWDIQGTDLDLTTGLYVCPSREQVATNTLWANPLPGASDYYTQGSIDNKPETLRFYYHLGANWARGNVGLSLPLNGNYDPAKGMACVWRMRTGEYNGIQRGPFRMYVPGPVAGSPVAVYFGLYRGNVVRMQANGGGLLAGVDQITLANKISDPLSDPNDPDSPRVPTYHVWSASGCYDAGFDADYAYFNLWIQLDASSPVMTQMMFTGTHGSVAGPGGKIYSFRANNNDGEENPGAAMGEIGNTSAETEWDFEFDYVRVLTLDVAGCPLWNGQGGCTVKLPWPDADEDGDVDQADFAVLQSCFSGDGVALSDPTVCGRFNRSVGESPADIDALDVIEFEKCATGPGISLDPENPPAGCDL